MRLSNNGLLPSRSCLSVAARACVIGCIGVGVTACASQQSPQYAGVYQDSVARPVQRANERQWKVEVEEDGKPSQAPPVRRMRPEEDDPTQPWSPNYGKSPGDIAPPPQQPARAAWPKPIETKLRTASTTTTSRGLSNSEADSVVLLAIHQHEMRNP